MDGRILSNLPFSLLHAVSCKQTNHRLFLSIKATRTIYNLIVDWDQLGFLINQSSEIIGSSQLISQSLKFYDFGLVKSKPILILLALP